MTEQKHDDARGASHSDAELCPVCRGNDGDNPCAYPGDGIEGCLREARMKRWREQEEPKCFDGGEACIDCLCMGDDLQLDAAKSAAAIAWGWLWHVTTADDRVKTARHLLGQMLDKDLKRYGIQTAKSEGAQVNVQEIEAAMLRGIW